MFLQRLKDLRVENNKTQVEIAALLYLNRELYRNYEKGNREIPTWAIIKLAEYYRVNIDYIFGLTNERAPYPKKKRG